MPAGLQRRHLPARGRAFRHEHAQRTGVNPEAQRRLEGDRLTVYPCPHYLTKDTRLQALGGPVAQWWAELDGTKQRSCEQPFELVERAGVDNRDLQRPRVQAVALTEPVPPCELVRVVRDDHGDDAFEWSLVGRRDTQRPTLLGVGEVGLELRLRHTKLVLPVAWIGQHLGVETERDVVDERATVDSPHVHAPLVVSGCEGIESSQWGGKIQAQVACEVV